MNTPNLPPLPIPGDTILVQGYQPDDIRLQAYALAAYQAGRDAGIADALAAVRQRYAGDNNREDAEVLRCAMAIDALKSGAKGGV